MYYDLPLYHKCCIGLMQNNWTPLHTAAQNSRIVVVEALIRLGANVNALDKVGQIRI